MAFKIDSDACAQCGVCEGTCGVQAIAQIDGKYTIDAEKCVDCGACAEACPVNAISAVK